MNPHPMPGPGDSATFPPHVRAADPQMTDTTTPTRPAHTPRTMDAGPWLGYTIRRARKAGRCDYWLGERGRCTNRIEVGDEYVEGELSDYHRAGGYGRDRYCMACGRGENEGAAS